MIGNYVRSTRRGNDVYDVSNYINGYHSNMENIVRNFATDLLRHRRYNYSQEPLEEFLLVNSDIDYHNFRILN